MPPSLASADFLSLNFSSFLSHLLLYKKWRNKISAKWTKKKKKILMETSFKNVSIFVISLIFLLFVHITLCFLSPPHTKLINSIFSKKRIIQEWSALQEKKKYASTYQDSDSVKKKGRYKVRENFIKSNFISDHLEMKKKKNTHKTHHAWYYKSIRHFYKTHMPVLTLIYFKY